MVEIQVDVIFLLISKVSDFHCSVYYLKNTTTKF